MNTDAGNTITSRPAASRRAANAPASSTRPSVAGCNSYQPLDVAQLANAPEELKAGKKFVCWREAIRNDKTTKVPVNPYTGHDAESDNPATWGTLDEAIAFHQSHRDTLHGIGRMFDPSDGIIGIDFDDCLDAAGNVIALHVAAKWLPRLNSYSEISPSGTGVKVWLLAKHDLDGKTGKRDSKQGVEVYRSHRYFTITGQRLPQFSGEVEARQAEVEEFYREIFSAKKITKTQPASARTPTTLTDADIIRRASEAKNGDTFRSLWAGDYQAAGYGSQSEADAALCSLLWFSSGGDRGAVERLMSQSALGQREKWQRADYRQSTLDLACNGEVYSPRMAGKNGSKPSGNPPAPTDALSVEYGPALLGEDGQFAINQQHFAARYVLESGVVHDPAVRRFYKYDAGTGLWLHQSPEITAREIGETFQRIAYEHSATYLLAKRTANMLQGLVNLSRGISERRDVFSRRHDLIHVANGMLVLDDAGKVELRPFAPEYFSRNRSEITWNPKADCQRFKSELLLSAMSESDANLIQRYVGQCLLGVNLSQTILVLRGTAGGGKTTLANVTEGMIGRHNVTELRIAQLCERFELQRLVGRTLLSGKDVPGDFLNMRPAHVLKALVGGDTLEGETKHGNESFSIEGRFNVLISTNTRLRVKLDSDAGAWRRRLVIVDYQRPKPAKPIPGFDSILLRDEGEGILKWAVEGAIQLRRELAATGTIQLTDEQRRRVDDLLSESDSVRSFVRDCLVAEHGSEVFVDQLTTAYRDYCEGRDWEPLRDQLFQQQLPDAMLEYFRLPRRTDLRRDGRAARGYRGVALQIHTHEPTDHPNTDDPDDPSRLMQVKREIGTGCLVITPGESSGSSAPQPATTGGGNGSTLLF